MALSIAAIICAILLPPVGVCIHDQGEFCTTRFLIALLLTFLAWIPGVIYALYVVLQ